MTFRVSVCVKLALVGTPPKLAAKFVHLSISITSE